MTLSARYVSQITVVDTLTGPYVGSNNDVTIDGLNTNQTLNANTVPAVSKHAAFQQAMTAGNAVISLLALPGLTADEIVNCNGLALQHIKLRNLITNANTITVSNAAANSYALLGAAYSFTLAPGQEVLMNLAALAPTANVTNKNIAINGNTNQILEILLTAG